MGEVSPASKQWQVRWQASSSPVELLGGLRSLIFRVPEDPACRAVTFGQESDSDSGIFGLA